MARRGVGPVVLGHGHHQPLARVRIGRGPGRLHIGGGIALGLRAAAGFARVARRDNGDRAGSPGLVDHGLQVRVGAAAAEAEVDHLGAARRCVGDTGDHRGFGQVAAEKDVELLDDDRAVEPGRGDSVTVVGVAAGKTGDVGAVAVLVRVRRAQRNRLVVVRRSDLGQVGTGRRDARVDDRDRRAASMRQRPRGLEVRLAQVPLVAVPVGRERRVGRVKGGVRRVVGDVAAQGPVALGLDALHGRVVEQLGAQLAEALAGQRD